MIKKIAVGALLFFMIIALLLSFVGLKRVALGGDFLLFIKSCSLELETYQIAIPDIPLIPYADTQEWWVQLVTMLTQFVNFIIQTLNILIKIINVVISLVQFIVILIKNLASFVDNVKVHNTSSSSEIEESAVSAVALFLA